LVEPIVSHGSGVTTEASQVVRKRRGLSNVIVKVSVKVFNPFEPLIAILAIFYCLRFDKST
jgi:hypothetical protein